MEADRVAALCRGFRGNDFTGWHRDRCDFVLDCGGFRVVSDGSLSVRIDDRRVRAELPLEKVTVYSGLLALGGGRGTSAWMMTAGWDPGRLRAMRGAPYGRNCDDPWDRLRDETWPEIDEMSPPPHRSYLPMDDRELRIPRIGSPEIRYATAVRDFAGALARPEGRVSRRIGEFEIGPETSILVRAFAAPRSASDVCCLLSHGNAEWRMVLSGRGFADGSGYGVRNGEFMTAHVTLNPIAMGMIDSDAGDRNCRTVEYLKEHLPERAPERPPRLDPPTARIETHHGWPMSLWSWEDSSPAPGRRRLFLRCPTCC